MDLDEVVRVLWRRFGHEHFKIAELSDTEVSEIARLLGLEPANRNWLGRRLTRMARGELWYEAGPNSKAKLVIRGASPDIGRRPEEYWIELG